VVFVPREGSGQVAVRPLLICLGERGGEGGDELRRAGVVEAHAPDGRAEGVFVGVDAPQAVVLAFGKVAEADLAVGCGQVGVAQVVVAEFLTEVAQRVEAGIADRGGAGEVARGDVDVPVDGVVVG
jgi:hypothetical protein